MMDIFTFEDRRMVDPQGVINDLLGQITRQAVTIYERNNTLNALKKEMADLKEEKEAEAISETAGMSEIGEAIHTKKLKAKRKKK